MRYSENIWIWKKNINILDKKYVIINDYIKKGERN